MEDVRYVQVYILHLLDGHIVAIEEDYGLADEDTLLGRWHRMKPDDLLQAGDTISGFTYVPKRSVLYIETSGVKKARRQGVC